MSADPQRWVRAVSGAPGLTPIAQSVGRVLASHADPLGERAAPTTAILMAATRASAATVTAAVAELARRGWVQRTAGGRGTARMYRLTIPAESLEVPRDGR